MDAVPLKLYVEDVTWTVHGRRIVDSILLDVAPGEFVGLIGPNGSGKSTLLRTIYRVLRPDAGRVRLDGEDVWALGAREAARRTAVVAQERGGDFDLTVHEVVMLGRHPHKGLLDRDGPADLALVDEALERVQMQAFAHRLFHTLSGGEKQRVLIARALAQQARLLVLDEPTNHLDIRYQMEILGLVRGLGVTVLAALHDLNLAARYCDRLYLLAGGTVVASGPPEQVLTPGLIRAVYGVEALVERHPRSGLLQVVFLGPAPGSLAGQ